MSERNETASTPSEGASAPATDPDADAFEARMREAFAPPLASLERRSVVVTGASAGIGLAVTLQLLAEGARVLAIARREERLAALARFVASGASPVSLGGALETLAGDVRDAAFRASLEARGLLSADAFVCNAGLARGLEPVERASESDWQEMIDTNVTAAFSLTRAAVCAMRARGGGHIVGLGSIAGHWAYENGGVYCATKHALRAFYQALRQETCGSGVRVSLMSPGMVRTEFSRVRFSGDTPRADAVYAGADPLEARDVAAVIVNVLKQPAHVNLDEVVCMPERQGSPFKVVRKPTS